MKKQKNKYDPKIETVKYLEIIVESKFGLILPLTQNCANFLDIYLVIQLKNLFLPSFILLKYRR